MVARPGAPFRSANAGEMSPEAAGRVDIKQYYSAGLRYKNIEPVTVSGFRRMDGSLDIGPVRGRVATLAQTNVVVTAGPHTDTTATIWQADVSGSVTAIDCDTLASSAGTQPVTAQVFSGGAWVTLAGPIDAGTTAAALTLATAPDGKLAATAVRLRATVTGTATITCGTVTVLTETANQDTPRYCSLTHDDGGRYLASLQTRFIDIYESDDWVAGCYLPTVSDTLLPGCNFYAENATIGIGHRDLETLRIRRGGADARWVRDLWPYDGLPEVDLGGTYAKTDDIWLVDITYSGSPTPYMSFTVDGETTPSQPFVDATDTPVAINDGSRDLTLTASNIKAALEALPSLGPTITVVITALGGNHLTIEITFGGALSGVEYQLVSAVPNTADVAALASHKQIGETDFEPLFSATQGWPGAFGLVQDRLAYGDIKAVPPAVGLSQAGEYFKLALDIAGDAAPRLDKLRAGQVAERVLAFAEATYFLVFTSRAVHFAANRTIAKSEPLNFTQISSSGTIPNCEPVLLETRVFYIAEKPKSDPPVGDQLLALGYSELEQTYEADPQHILATHLVDNVIRFKGQRSTKAASAPKLWMLRNDGRLVAACIIRSQEILGFCEWRVWGGGEAKEMHVDAGNDLRVAVLRNNRLRHERLDGSTFFQAAVTATCDLAGTVEGLDHLNGKQVWVCQDDFVEGPFTVSGGAIAPGADWAGAIEVGLWEPPVFESMPRYFMTRSEEIVKRPGRIHAATLEVIATTSVAVGANGQPAEDVPLFTMNTPVDAAQPPVTGKVTRAGLLGSVVGTTLVITQARPGELHVRDFTIEEKL